MSSGETEQEGPEGRSCTTTYGKLNPRLVFASTVCSASAGGYHCYREGYRGPMFDCTIPEHVYALQNDELIVGVDCFRGLPFSLIAYLDIIGIAFGMVALGLYVFDRSEKWASIGALDEQIKGNPSKDDGDGDVPSGALGQPSRPSCCACTAAFKRKAVGNAILFTGVAGYFAYASICMVAAFHESWGVKMSVRRGALEGAALLALVCYAMAQGVSLMGYDDDTDRQTIIEILFRKHGTTSGGRIGCWTKKSTASLLSTVQPSKSFKKSWIENELPKMNGAELWFSFNSRWQLKRKEAERKEAERSICTPCYELVCAPLCCSKGEAGEEEDEKRKQDIIEGMNWEILSFASVVMDKLLASSKSELTLEDVWFATWDIIGNEKEGSEGKDAWWMLGRSYWHNEQFSASISTATSEEPSTAGLQDATAIVINDGFGFN